MRIRVFRAAFDATACQGLMDVSILTATPVVLGVLTCTEEEQAVKRSTGNDNHGRDWGKLLLIMMLAGVLSLAVVVLLLLLLSACGVLLSRKQSRGRSGCCCCCSID